MSSSFSSRASVRAKMKNKNEQEIALLKQFDQAYNMHRVLNFLQALVEKSMIVQILEQKEGLRSLYKKAIDASRLLVVSRVSNQKVPMNGFLNRSNSMIRHRFSQPFKTTNPNSTCYAWCAYPCSTILSRRLQRIARVLQRHFHLCSDLPGCI
ncbi:hypothetical protein ACFXTH_034414 [Malus domestica]